MRHLTIILFMALFVAGCGDSSSAGQFSRKKDPKTTFETFMHQYVSNLQTVYDEAYHSLPATTSEDYIYGSKEGQKRPNKVLLDSVLYDVRKTDSLIQPYVGTISLTVTSELKFFRRKQRWETQTHAWSLNFGWQDGKWAPTTVTHVKDGETTRITPEDSFWKAYEKTSQ